jgi:amino acid adenylation domain-containing protein/FkbM family methyltransferase
MTRTLASSETHLDWWKERLAQPLATAGLPEFRQRSSVYRRRSSTVSVPLAGELAGELSRAAGDDTGRLHALLLAAVAGVLYRYGASTAAERIALGAPTPAAAERETVLPIVVTMQPQDTFAQLVEHSAGALAQSYAHADCGDEAIRAAVGVDDVTNRHPLFAVAVRVAGHHAEVGDLRHDVTATLRLDERGGALELEHNANVHDEATVTRLGGHVVGFLADALARPDAALHAVDYLPAAERATLLDEWSAGPTTPADGRCVQELVEAAVAAHGDAEAVVFDDLTWTYDELNRRANQLAHYLVERGAGRGTRIGLCLPAGAGLLVGLLGIVKSGGTVVPLVPTFPARRNAIVMEEAGLALVVTDTALADMCAGPGRELVCVDRDAADIERCPTTNPSVGAQPDDTLYVLFTSGSTGRPKGVRMPHRAIVNLVGWQRERGADPCGRRTLQRTSIGFDVSFQEIFSTLAYGGSLVVASDAVRDDVSSLAPFIERHEISRVFLPLVALEQLAATPAHLRQQALRSLGEVIVAGEQLQVSMSVRRMFHEIDAGLDNQYGPTETHVVTAYELTGPSTRWRELPPIGRPVRNVRTYVLDAWLQPVPAGVPGELYVGGAAVADGYIDADDTAARFVADPFSDDARARVYKTGDRVRFSDEGEIEFLGRDDDQVKIRGYRIELGEIEANLRALPGIRSAAVRVVESEVVGKQLAAYVVTEVEGTPSAAAIREQLLERLPGHTVPASANVVHLAELPTTPTGKVDRKALPAPARQLGGDDVAAARSDTEQAVATLWSQALGLEGVGRDEDFVALGGHSLIAIEVVSELNSRYAIALPLRLLLAGTTVAALAAEIDRLRGATDAAQPTAAEVPAAADAPAANAPALEEVELPNGRRIACLHRPEAEYLYVDVFEHATYDRGGIEYPANGCVFDVGAHIGLFTLYALEKSPELEVVAFEPCPPLFEALQRNTQGLDNVQLCPFGLGSRDDTAQLTHYPQVTGMSSFAPDPDEERALLSGILRNLGKARDAQSATQLATSDEYLAERFASTTFACRRRTLSDVLAETGVERVDLLKIDVQKAELDVLEGIAPDDWRKIRQLAIEVHDLDGRLHRVTELLVDKGYRVSVAQDALHVGTPVHFVYAV